MTTVIAHSYSPSVLTGNRIRPGDLITPIEGSWAKVSEVLDHEAKCREANDFRSQFESFFNRLPEVK